MTRWSAAPLALVLAATACSAAPAQAPRKTPSGLPVPRYVSLKFNEVNARRGPGDDHRLLWVYRAKGLPVQVVAETRTWRRVCDHQGRLSWVKSTGVDSRRVVLYRGAGRLPLLGKPEPGAKVRAWLSPRSMAGLDRCRDGWCRVKASGVAGWAPGSAFWGTDPQPQCR